ncbi:MAG TPA: long-chain fatty acid--CoA ligase [Pirellulales bacterium]|jgi:long-chain acyl-CoA synthetase|nr:long-chain fatty acid--CoA ligase [Pirellulales bacterium]
MLNLAMVLTENAERFPDRTAVILGERKLSYQELETVTNRLANSLVKLGLHPGQKMVLMLPNIPEFVVGYYGILKPGGVVVPINVLYKAREIEFLLSDSEAIGLICCTEFLDEALEAYRNVETCHHLIVVDFVRPAPAVDDPNVHRLQDLIGAGSPEFEVVARTPEDTAVIGYTSGTTGKPKGAELSHFNLFYQCRVLPELTGEPRQPNEVRMAVLPLFHSFGQSCVMNTVLALGSTMTCMPRFDPALALQMIERDKVTHFAAVPTMYHTMLNHPDRAKYDLSSLRMCGSGGAPMPVETLDFWQKNYNFPIQEGYGLTETSPTATWSQGPIKPKAGSCGKAIWGCQIKIVDDNGKTLPANKEGEVLIRGVNVMKGYYKQPEATAQILKNGWFYTGDIGKLDEEGYLYIVGRKKDMILRGGFNIYPREIEELLYEHPAVAEAAVVGVKHDELGEEIKAVVYLKPGSKASEDEIQAYCKERIAAFKYPRIVEIRDTPLPKGPSAKILKRELIEEHERARTATTH